MEICSEVWRSYSELTPLTHQLNIISSHINGNKFKTSSQHILDTNINELPLKSSENLLNFAPLC